MKFQIFLELFNNKISFLRLLIRENLKFNSPNKIAKARKKSRNLKIGSKNNGLDSELEKKLLIRSKKRADQAVENFLFNIDKKMGKNCAIFDNNKIPTYLEIWGFIKEI